MVPWNGGPSTVPDITRKQAHPIFETCLEFRREAGSEDWREIRCLVMG